MKEMELVGVMLKRSKSDKENIFGTQHVYYAPQLSVLENDVFLESGPGGYIEGDNEFDDDFEIWD